MRVATFTTFAPLLAFLFFAASDRFDREGHGQLQSVATVVLMLSVPVAIAGHLVRARVRCKVCGLNLPSCVEARVAGRRRWEWFAALEACPTCDDDGAASAESRARWETRGRPREDSYWNLSRIAIVIAALVMMLIGLRFV